MKCFVPTVLRWMAGCIGEILDNDSPMAALACLSEAQVCVEVDLRKVLPAHV